MNDKYQNWIANHGSWEKKDCESATSKMKEAFPELSRVRGHYFCPVFRRKASHWWCKDSSGEIVDPTAGQFPSKGHGHYEEWDESQPEPTGKCPECGAYAYDGNTFCSDDCDAKYMAYLNGAPL